MFSIPVMGKASQVLIHLIFGGNAENRSNAGTRTEPLLCWWKWPNCGAQTGGTLEMSGADFVHFPNVIRKSFSDFVHHTMSSYCLQSWCTFSGLRLQLKSSKMLKRRFLNLPDVLISLFLSVLIATATEAHGNSSIYTI